MDELNISDFVSVFTYLTYDFTLYVYCVYSMHAYMLRMSMNLPVIFYSFKEKKNK